WFRAWSLFLSCGDVARGRLHPFPTRRSSDLAAHPAEVRYLLRDVDVVLGLAAVTQRAEGVLAPAPGHVALGHRAGERRPDGEGRDRPEALDELRSADRVVRTVAALPRGVGSPAVQGADREVGARVGGAA